MTPQTSPTTLKKTTGIGQVFNQLACHDGVKSVFETHILGVADLHVETLLLHFLYACAVAVDT
jgi:hypothetical protein